MRRDADSIERGGRRLRLVGDDDDRQRPPSSTDDARARSDRVRERRQVHREWEVGAENRAAAGISTFDARWVMAVRVSEALEGGPAAVLRPEARARLVSTAGRMGLRPFDANMVIAIVQDAARQGRPALALDDVDRLMLVGEPQGRRPRSYRGLLLAAGVLALAWAGILLRWLIG